MSKIHVLYVGNDDWTTKYSIPDNIEFEVYESDESEPSTNRPARKLMDLVILDRDITLSEEKKFTKFTRGYCLFATENVQMLTARRADISRHEWDSICIPAMCSIFWLMR